MLEPALAHKEELLAKFAKEIYTDKYFYYTGYGHAHSLPKIEDEDGVYQYAIMNGNKLLGYLAYKFYVDTNSAENFGLYAFDNEDYSLAENALILGRDTLTKLEELVHTFHKVSWRLIDGNPVEKSYDKFCKRYNGNKVTLHDVTIDSHGNYHNEHIYEIIDGNRYVF